MRRGYKIEKTGVRGCWNVVYVSGNTVLLIAWAISKKMAKELIQKLKYEKNR